MHLFQTTRIAFKALQRRQSRSALTILGIVIGITSIMLIAALGSSAKGIILGELGGFGVDIIGIEPGKEPDGPTDFIELLFTESLKQEEYEAITNPANVPDVIAGTPEVLVPGSVSFEGETFRPGFMLGVDASFFMEVMDLELSAGRVYDEHDIESRARVALIGSEIAEELFPNTDPIGKDISIRDQKFKVVGTFASRGQVLFFNVDEIVLMPHTSAHTYLTGTKHYAEIIVQVSSPEAVPRAVYDITQTLRELHDITDPEDDDFHIQTQEGAIEQVGAILTAFTLFLSLVVAVSLVVGGVGVMNIMLVSVTERTREIGLRKAVGATSGIIVAQFLVEAVVLTLTGGIIGILFGTLLSLIASFGLSLALSTPWAYTFPYTAAIIGLAASVLTGLVFGLYPARQAAKKSPIEALRYE